MQSQPDPHATVLPLIVELSGELRPLASSAEIALPLRHELESTLQRICGDLGIPATVSVEVRPGDAQAPLRLNIGGIVRDASEAILFRLLGDEDNRTAAGLTRVAGEIVRAEPELLLTPEALAVFVGDLAASDSTFTRLLSAVRALLHLGISIQDFPRHIRYAVDLLARDGTDEAVTETLIARLRPSLIDIRMHTDYARSLFEASAPAGPVILEIPIVDRNAAQMFSRLCDDLFYELGVRVPLIRLLPADDLPEESFAVRINSLECAPIRGLATSRCFVEEIPEQLKLLNIKADEFANPRNGQPGASIPIEDRPAASEAHLRTWDPLEFVGLALGRELRLHASRLIDVEIVDYELSCAHQLFPDLVDAALNSVSVERLTAVLRSLVQDGISIRDVRTVLNRVCDYGFVVTDTRRLVVFDDRLHIDRALAAKPAGTAWYLSQHVRSGLRRYISHKYTGGTLRLNAVLLDTEIEGSVLRHLASTANPGANLELPSFLMRLKSSLWDEVRYFSKLYQGGDTPVILTIAQVAAFLRDVLATDFPAMPVLAYSELSPEVNIHPLVRVALN